jgi:hypothetical protein
MTGQPGVTLESLDYEWGDAYLICYARDQWAALRRDTHRFLAAATLDTLAARIKADYAASPVPRDTDPPGTDDYLTAPDEDEHEHGAPCGDGERLRLLMGLRATFPHWNISYSPFFRAWTARNDDATICQGTPALLWFALTLTERKQRQARHRHGPGRDWRPGEDTSPS